LVKDFIKENFILKISIICIDIIIIKSFYKKTISFDLLISVLRTFIRILLSFVIFYSVINRLCENNRGQTRYISNFGLKI